MNECPGCQDLFAGDGYDPGHNYGCGFVRVTPCHDPYCSERCFDNSNEAAADREYADFHGGEGPPSFDEQLQRAWEKKEGR